MVLFTEFSNLNSSEALGSRSIFVMNLEKKSRMRDTSPDLTTLKSTMLI